VLDFFAPGLRFGSLSLGFLKGSCASLFGKGDSFGNLENFQTRDTGLG
jgi:hypothetical protein